MIVPEDVAARDSAARLVASGLFALWLVTGCGTVETANNLDSSVSYDAAIAAMGSGDYQQAAEHWTSAVDAGGLNPDQYATAMIKRAECYGRLGEYAAAHADLDSAEIGAPNLDEVYVVRSFVFGKEGKQQESASAMKMARKENSRAKPMKE